MEGSVQLERPCSQSTETHPESSQTEPEPSPGQELEDTEIDLPVASESPSQPNGELVINEYCGVPPIHTT